jgi:hypothetical protein
MTHRVSYLVAGLAGVLMAALAAEDAPGGGPKPKAPEWGYAWDLSARHLGEEKFTDTTKKYGVEVFRDANTNLGVYLTQTGSLGVADDFAKLKLPPETNKKPDFVAGLDLKARKAGELEFTSTTLVYSMEIFLDLNANNWMYITEKGNLAVCPAPKTAEGGGQPRAATWLYSMDLRCRKAGNKLWTGDTPFYGLEVYRDGNTNNLIYICNTGALAVVPAGEAAEPGKDKGPEWLHGLDLHVRKVGEKDFTKATRKLGVEMFRDGNNDNVIIITEVGNIAVLPGKKGLKGPTTNPRDPRFLHGLDLQVRQAGEKDFTDKTRKVAVEVFREENLGLTIYVSETGAIAAAKQ